MRTEMRKHVCVDAAIKAPRPIGPHRRELFQRKWVIVQQRDTQQKMRRRPGSEKRFALLIFPTSSEERYGISVSQKFPRRLEQSVFIASSQDDFVRAFAKIPTLLHTCGERREEALKHYKLCFSLVCGGRPVHIDFEIDRLYIYTARTFRRFFAYGHTIFDYKLNNESKIFQSKTRCLILNCHRSRYLNFSRMLGLEISRRLLWQVESVMVIGLKIHSR